jgi:hypothetical protein
MLRVLGDMNAHNGVFDQVLLKMLVENGRLQAVGSTPRWSSEILRNDDFLALAGAILFATTGVDDRDLGIASYTQLLLVQ